MTRPRYHLITYGCQMNKADSERIAALMEGLGFSPTDDEREADVILLNTCSVRQSAEDRVFGKLKDFAALRERRPGLVVGVTGCLPGRDADGKLRAKMPGADLFFPISELPELPRLLAGLRPDLVASSGELDSDYLKIAPRRDSRSHAYVTIQTGCDRFCTYCVVPYARGRERNRPVADILVECRALVASGILSIELLGQVVNAYRAPDPETFSKDNPYRNSFAALLWEIDRLSAAGAKMDRPGLNRFSYASPHPMHMDDEVIDALALPRAMSSLALPAQSGSDEVLRRMNRRYTAAQYLDIVQRIRARVPNVALGTDVIVGFPGETEAQFEETLALYRAADFDISYPAMYSPRSGTVSAKRFSDDVPRAEKKRRWHALQDLMEETTARKNQAYVGREVEVLVDEFTRGWCVGQSREMKRVRFRSDEDLTGRVIKVKITKAMTWMLEGNLVGGQL